MKKILSIFLTLCLFANVSFAFDPYADDEVETKSYKKLYYGIVLTLVGGFLAYDGFSFEDVDVSKPSVDYTTVLHSEWVHGTDQKYYLRSGYTDNSIHPSGGSGDYTKYKYKIDDTSEAVVYNVEKNILYNNGNVDLKNLTIEVRYKFDDGKIIGPDGQHLVDEGYHIATNLSKTIEYVNIDLKKGKSISWEDVWYYTTVQTDQPEGKQREPYVGEGSSQNDGTTGLNLGEGALNLMDIRVILNKNQQYKPIYEKRHKSDIEGVAGIMVGIAGIYFIIDHFVDMHKFNAYAKKHDLNFKVATASNEYKLMLQKRI